MLDDLSGLDPEARATATASLVALQNNVVVWVDVAMVRRELGADRSDLPGLGPRLDALEAVIGAVYLEHGYVVAAGVVTLDAQAVAVAAPVHSLQPRTARNRWGPAAALLGMCRRSAGHPARALLVPAGRARHGGADAADPLAEGSLTDLTRGR